MRTTIACERCRRSKVKCKHNGQPPCISCAKTGRTATCVLAGPVTAKRQRLSIDQDDAQPIYSQQDINQVFDSIPRSRFVKAINTFQTQFPDFGYIQPSDLECHDGPVNPVKALWYLAILAVADRYMDNTTDSELIPLITTQINSRLTTSPSLTLVQTILVLSLCSWGQGDGFSAWMHSGMATRMAQGLLSTGLSNHGRDTLSELEKRTLWTCFVMDKLLSCGTRRQAMFRDKLHISLPLDDVGFALGQAPADPTVLKSGLDSTFTLIIEGLDIWSRIHSWTAEGGRRQPGMTEPGQCPWVETSEWACMRRELLLWRESQSLVIRYPETKTSAHAHLGQAEKFGYINLIYYVSLLFLHREYIPFAPVGEILPRGPIEAPLLKATAPPDFWTENLTKLYDSSTQISNLLQDLEQVGSPLRTPFSGLCAFSSALRAIYAASFPSFSGFDQAQVEETEAQAARTMGHLGKISKIWKIAEEWLEVLNTAKNLFRRVNLTNTMKPVKRSRYDYPELEDEINVGSLKGMPRPSFSRPEPTSVAVGPGTEQLVAPAQTGGSDETSLMTALEAEFGVGDDFMNSEGWKLVSFWDDPHLLSTSLDPNLQIHDDG